MHADETATYYTATRKYDVSFPSLSGDVEAEVAIIGGGFSGIHTALELAEHGVTDTVVLEARTLGFGGTGRNGGQVMAGIGHDLDALRDDIGDDGVRAILALSELGPQIMRERIATYDIDADFRDGYVYLAYNARQAATLRGWEKEFRSLGTAHEIRYVEGEGLRGVVGSEVYRAGLFHGGGGHVHSLNLLLGEAKALRSRFGVRLFENSPALQVDTGDEVVIRTPTGRVRARKLVWAVDGFNNRIEPELHRSTINVYAFNSVTEPLDEALALRISPIRAAYSDIRPVINYYRVTNDNRLMFGSSTQLIERIPGDLKGWNRRLMLEVFPYLADVRIDLAWGGPMATSRNLFPQIGTLPGRPNVYFVQGYSGFGVTPSQIVCRILAEGILGGSERYRLLSSIARASIPGKDQWRALWVTLGKAAHQLAGYSQGRR